MSKFSECIEWLSEPRVPVEFLPTGNEAKNKIYTY